MDFLYALTPKDLQRFADPRMNNGADRTNTRTVARAIMLVAMGVALSPFTSIPIGIAKINPTQHFVNVVAAVLLGPWWAPGSPE